VEGGPIEIVDLAETVEDARMETTSLDLKLECP